MGRRETWIINFEINFTCFVSNPRLKCIHILNSTSLWETNRISVSCEHHCHKWLSIIINHNLSGARPLHEAMLFLSAEIPWTNVNFDSINIQYQNHIWKCRLHNVGHFVQTSTCYSNFHSLISFTFHRHPGIHWREPRGFGTCIKTSYTCTIKMVTFGDHVKSNQKTEGDKMVPLTNLGTPAEKNPLINISTGGPNLYKTNICHRGAWKCTSHRSVWKCTSS